MNNNSVAKNIITAIYAGHTNTKWNSFLTHCILQHTQRCISLGISKKRPTSTLSWTSVCSIRMQYNIHKHERYMESHFDLSHSKLEFSSIKALFHDIKNYRN